MGKLGSNLKRLLEFLGISNVALARGINVDASLVSRWLNGHRRLKLSSDFMDRLAEYLSDRAARSGGEGWLKRQMGLDGLSFDYSAPGGLQNALKLWLSADGETVGRVLNLPAASAGAAPDSGAESRVRTGFAEIAAFIEGELDRLPPGPKIDIHLSSEDTGILLHEGISGALLGAMAGKGASVRLLISLSSDTMAMSRLLSRYMQAIIEGSLGVSVVHGMTQAITNQATFIFAGESVLIVCETPKSIAPPIGAAARDESFVKECRKSFERAYNYSRALLQRYNDNYSRNILEILYQEFAMPGNLDIIKDSVNPMYMTVAAYDRFLKTFGHRGEQFKWRSAEFVRFKTGMDENLRGGTVFREVLSASRLEQIVKEGKCKMPALYFMNAGMVYLDAEGCLSIIEGYIDYLRRVPNFNLLILDGMAALNENNCWQLKRDSHVAVNGWSKDENIILYSNQLMLTHEFQVYFDGLWDKGIYSEGHRQKTVSMLRDMAGRLREGHNLT